MSFHFKIPINIQTKQSVRTAENPNYAAAQKMNEILPAGKKISLKGKNKFIQYQPTKTKNYEKSIRDYIQMKLPRNFQPFDGPIEMKLIFHFKIPKSATKKMKIAIKGGEKVYKYTKPDISDNTNKPVLDALQGTLFTNDSRVAIFQAEKLYTIGSDFIEIIINELKNPY